ncbi:MAG TPA: hypothetical protein EYO33_26430 [Phycisphaerales bacterium]|nr:hypothetical protein [Phycisphaerales bacterium]
MNLLLVTRLLRLAELLLGHRNLLLQLLNTLLWCLLLLLTTKCLHQSLHHLRNVTVLALGFRRERTQVS